MLLGLRTAQYHVSDIGQARDWYTQALGVEPYFDEPYYVGFDIGGFELGLIPDSETAGRPGSVAVYWGVDDIQTAFGRLLSAGARPLTDIEDVGEGIKKAMVLDPFGNSFGIIENPHFVKR